MASEIRNNFVQSKMNKDLDDRLLQPGEYREASNVNISRSEGDDVGALENVLGNDLLSNFNFNTPGIEIIGYISDETNNRAFFMATNYTDSSEDGVSNFAPYFSYHAILGYDFSSNVSYTLVSGSWLNFSKRSNIYGINIVENLLFWTDNRNQPRKINIDKAIENSSYYIQEETISVAKYYPYNAPYIHDDVLVDYLSCKQTNLKPTAASSVNWINNTPVTDILVNEANFNKVKVSYIYKRTEQDFQICTRLDVPPGVSLNYEANQRDRYGGSVFWIKEKISAASGVEINGNNKGEGYTAGDAYTVASGGSGSGAGLSIEVLSVDSVGGITALQVYDTPSTAFLETGGNGYSVNEVYSVNAPFGGQDAQIKITAVDYKLRLNGLASRSLPTTTTSGTVRFTYPTATNKSEKWLPVTCIGQVTEADPNFAYYPFIDNFVTNTPAKYFMLQNIKGKWPEVGMKLTCPGKDNPWDSNGGILNPEYIITQVIRVKSEQNGNITRQCANEPFQYQYNSTCQDVEINEGSISGTCLLRVNYAPYDNANPPNPLIVAGDYIQLQSLNPHYSSEWPGDESFLEDKFVRFAYRFKFDDGEYSLISPFTQPVFIPKQNGYFLDYVDESDTTTVKKQEDDVGAKTIIPFMENKVNNVGINIEMPTIVSNLKQKYKVAEIDILYKESNSLNIMLIQSIPTDSDEVTNNNSSIFKYDYQSKKPFKLLPEREITRVSDKVPVRAFTQSIVGNRVVYGNFLDKHSPPDGLDYNVGISAKYSLDQNLGWKFANSIQSVPPFNPTFSIISYPNHSLKQNRTYQVGVVLSDKYGRQSDVILSKDEESSFVLPYGGPSGATYVGSSFAPNTSTTRFGGSTVYSKYNDFFPDYPVPSWAAGRIGENGGWVYRDGLWNGDSLKVLFREKIPSIQTGEFEEGYPGLQKPQKTSLTVNGNVVNDNEIEFDEKPLNVREGDVCFVDSTWCVVTSVNVNDFKVELNQNVDVNNSTNIIFYGNANELGWYTYKIVVKQTEQDYYNAYLPNVSLASEISALVNTQENFGLSNNGGTYYTSLISDNINKIAADVTKVQPEQTQFSTSDDVLYPRVGYNSTLPSVVNDGPYSSGFFQAQQSVQVNGIGKLEDLGLQSVKLNGVKLGRVLGIACAVTTCAAGIGRVVYNLATTTDGDGEGCRVKVGVTTAGGALPNYVVVTNPGRDYKNGDTITVPARSSSSSGYVEGQATWSSFEFVLSTGTSPFGVDEPFGEDVEPRQSPGLFNASSNPNVAVLFNNANLPIGQDSDSRTNVFSAFEIKPLNSNLDIYWETSTSGLISELNEAIEYNVDAQELT